MKIKEIRSMSKEDLQVKLEELKKELIKINAQISTGTTPKSPGHVKQIKKSIAKILTILQEKLKGEGEVSAQSLTPTHKIRRLIKKHE